MKAEKRPRGSDWDLIWDYQGTLQFFRDFACKVVALQFPDELLKDAALVVEDLAQLCQESALQVRLYLLADTSYNSLGVDEVAAAHVNADAVVHYGRASFSALSQIPAYFVLGHESLNIDSCAQELVEYAAAPLNPEGMKALLVLLDQPLVWQIPTLGKAVKAHPNYKEGLPVVFAETKTRVLQPIGPCSSNGNGRKQGSRGEPSQIGEPSTAVSSVEDSTEPTLCKQDNPCCRQSPDREDSDTTDAKRQDDSEVASTSGRGSLGGYSWNLPHGISEKDCIWIWVGPDDTSSLLQLHMTFHDCEWAMLEPNEPRWQHGLPLAVTRSLKRRYYLVEKAKNANIVGIVVGTLGVAGFKQAVDRVRDLAKAAGKKTYTLLMGKPSPAKLANFPEIDIFVLVADPQGQILDSKEYYAPIITPYEAQLAFQPGMEWTEDYRLDFDSLLEGGTSAPEQQLSNEPRYSLVDSGYHSVQNDQSIDDSSDAGDQALVERKRQELAAVDPSKRHLIQVGSASDYLAVKRSYQGLEAPVMGAEKKIAELALEGRSGRAAHYQDEDV